MFLTKITECLMHCSIILFLFILLCSDQLFSEKISEVKYEITKVREVPSEDPKRIGKVDLMISYQIDGKPSSIITLPSEKASPERIEQAIIEREKNKNIDIGKEYEIKSIVDVLSLNPKRKGKIDVWVYYTKEGKCPDYVTIPKEKESPEEIKEAIKEKENRKKSSKNH